MFYYKNKVKAVVMIVVVVLLLAVAATVCLWDDTSIKSLNAPGATASFDGSALPNTRVGDKLAIDGVEYTVGYSGTVNGERFITVYSYSLGSRIDQRYDVESNHWNYDGTGTSRSSSIYSAVWEYYFYTLANSRILLYSNGVTYSKVRDYIVPHLDYSWNLWLPSAREMCVPQQAAMLEGSVQPVMNYYNSNARRDEAMGVDYWLRSPVSTSTEHSYFITGGGFINVGLINPAQFKVVRVALNLRIGL